MVWNIGHVAVHSQLYSVPILSLGNDAASSGSLLVDRVVLERCCDQRYRDQDLFRCLKGRSDLVM